MINQGGRGGGRGGKEERRGERKGEDSNKRKGGKWEEEQREGGKREGEERVRQPGGDRGGCLERDPWDHSSTPMINYPHPAYPSFQRFPSGSIMDIPQVQPIPLIPNYYQQPPPQTTQPPLPPMQAPLPPHLGLTTAVQQAMLEYQRRYNTLQ